MRASAKYIFTLIFCIAFAVWMSAWNGTVFFGNREKNARFVGLEGMDEVKYRSLFNKRGELKFYALSPERQQLMRNFHESLQNAPDKERLERTLEMYHRWYRALRPSQRSALQQPNLRPEERLALIKRISESSDVPSPRMMFGPRPSDAQLAETLENMDPDRQYLLLGMFPQMMLRELEMTHNRPKRPFGGMPDGGGGFRRFFPDGPPPPNGPPQPGYPGDNPMK